MMDKQRKIFLKSDLPHKIHRVLDLFTDNDLLEIYDNGSVDIHHANAHQGPVIDSFDIIGHNIMKFPQT